MATKKEKHLAAVAKREKFLEEEKLRNLEALEEDRARRKKMIEDAERKRAEIDAEFKQKMSRSMALKKIIENDEQRIALALAASILMDSSA